ncbi:MAG: sensor histidine kinase [Anaerolineales bacterium]
MSTLAKSEPRWSLPLRFILGVTATVALALLIFIWLMQPPMGELGLMAAFLSITALVSVVAGYGAYRSGLIAQSPRLRWSILGSCALSALLTFINVWLTARLMFASAHDLALATILLLFAGGIAIAFGCFFSEALTDRITQVANAAEAITAGQLSTRAPVHGRDEMAALATTFNGMAAQLETTARKQRELESLRRDLIAWVSHDLQTPLASIRAMVEALADGVVDDAATQQRYLRTAQRDIQSLSALIDDLFQMAQLDAGGLQLDRTHGSLTDLVSDTLESFSELATRQTVTLTGTVAPNVDSVLMDTQRIGRVLNNLVRNALQHSPSGGTVNVNVTRKAGNVHVEVRDSGDGIPTDDAPHIFDRFYRGEKSRNRATGGAGLGLAIAKGIVEAHSGQIGVASTAGEGASFWFTLPG